MSEEDKWNELYRKYSGKVKKRSKKKWILLILLFTIIISASVLYLFKSKTESHLDDLTDFIITPSSVSASQMVTVSLSGLDRYNGKSAYIYKDNCNGKFITSCKILNGECEESFKAPDSDGSYVYCAKLEDLVAIKELIVKSDTTSDSSIEKNLFDFSIERNPISGSVYQGGSNTTVVSATLTEGTSKSVAFSYSDLPSGATASFSTTSCDLTCTSTLTITTNTSTPTGSYAINITATSNGVIKTTKYTLVVNQLIQCTSGICCNLSTKMFKPYSYKCQENISIEYGCPWGNNLGGNVGVRYQHRYCSGSSANCDGILKWDDWTVYKNCKQTETCTNGQCILPPPLVLIVVNSSIQSGIQASLDQYKSDIEAEGYVVNIYSLTSGTPSDLKNYLKTQLPNNLTGVVLVGDLPVPWFERIDDGERITFPIDFFYMDLDGNWIDTDNNGTYDKQDAGNGDKQPEIWIGRITPNGFGDAIELINKYFRKDHDYRTGKLTLPHKALVYIAMDAEYDAGHYNLESIYGTNIRVIPYEDSSKNNYTNEMNQGYECLIFNAHSNATSHWFERTNEHLYSNEITNPKAIFYMLENCVSGRYTSTEYLGGAYIFVSDYVLVAFADTDVGTIICPGCEFFPSLSRGNTLGQAYKDHLSGLITSNRLCEIDPTCQYTLLGDPTLRLPT